jgi:glutamine amidotransferase
MSQPSIVIVDYGVGNIRSIENAICSLGYRKIAVSMESAVLSSADAIVLPGVGAFGECAKNLRQRHLDEMLAEVALVKRTPLLGICVGMQLLAEYSLEGGYHHGLGWIPGSVQRLQLPGDHAVPHVGWNSLAGEKSDIMFSRLNSGAEFYFDHSYHFICDEKFVAAYVECGERFIAAVQLRNIFGVQFHPEKSHTNGLKLFRSFFEWVKAC